MTWGSDRFGRERHLHYLEVSRERWRRQRHVCPLGWSVSRSGDHIHQTVSGPMSTDVRYIERGIGEDLVTTNVTLSDYFGNSSRPHVHLSGQPPETLITPCVRGGAPWGGQPVASTGSRSPAMPDRARLSMLLDVCSV